MTMEARVLGVKKEYNRLKTEWKDKKKTLSSSNAVLSAKDIHVQEKGWMEGRIEDLERALGQVRDKLAMEELATSKLWHMKNQRIEQNSSLLRPLEELKCEFKAVNATVEAAIEEVDGTEALNRVNHAEIQSQLQRLRLQRHSHAQALETRAQKYRDRRGFEEFRKRYKQQKLLLRTIAHNEGDMRDIDGKLQEIRAAEANLASISTSEIHAKEQENLFLRLKETTNAAELGEIVGYWDFLQATQQRLKGTIEGQTAKIVALRDQLVAANIEFSELKWSREPSGNATLDVLEAAENQLKSSRSLLETKSSQVPTTQLAAWQEQIHQITTTLHYLSASTADLPIPELCERVVQRTLSFL